MAIKPNLGKNGDMPKVLLIYPGRLTPMFRGYNLPLGLLYLARALIDVGISPSIFDTRINHVRDLELKDYLFVGITMLTGEMITQGLEIAHVIKSFNPKIPVVVGGVHPSVLPEQTLANELVDIVVIGEGEKTVSELAQSLLGERELSDINGIAFKDAEKNITVTPPREHLDMNQLDYRLPYELLDIDYTTIHDFPVHTSRGCPYRCGFCYNTVVNKRRFRQKSPERVIEELSYLYERFNITSFNFGSEDEFFIDTGRVARICEHIIRTGMKVNWCAFCRFNTFDKTNDEFVRLLKESGCKLLLFGAESGSQRILDDVIKKDITIDQIIRGVERLKKADIAHLVSFMSCLPGENRDDLEASFQLIDRISRDNPKLFINGIFTFCPIPGTPLFDLLTKQYNFTPPDSLVEWGHYEMLGIPLPMITWQSPEYAKMCKSLYLTSSFPFYNELFESYTSYKNFVKEVPSSYYHLYIYYLMGRVARFRWKHRYFKYPVDLLVFDKIRSLLSLLSVLYHKVKKIMMGLKGLNCPS